MAATPPFSWAPAPGAAVRQKNIQGGRGDGWLEGRRAETDEDRNLAEQRDPDIGKCRKKEENMQEEQQFFLGG